MISPRCTFTIAAAVILCPHAIAQEASPAPRQILAVEDEYPHLSPDGKRVAFESNRLGVDQIFVADIDGSSTRPLTASAEENETPIWSPDGESILFARRLGQGRAAQLDIFAMDADGGNIRNLTNNEAGHDDHHKFSADGRRIVFNSSRRTPLSTLSEEQFENYGWDYDIWVMNVDGSDQRALVELPGWDTYPSFSPDGESLLWRRVLGDEPRNSEIFLADADGNNPKNISNHPAFDGYPAWSPDGKWILFVSNRDNDDDSRIFRLYVMRPDGSDVRRLTNPEQDEDDVRPAWSADGTTIVFNRVRGSDARIMILPVELDSP